MGMWCNGVWREDLSDTPSNWEACSNTKNPHIQGDENRSSNGQNNNGQSGSNDKQTADKKSTSGQTTAANFNLDGLSKWLDDPDNKQVLVWAGVALVAINVLPAMFPGGRRRRY